MLLKDDKKLESFFGSKSDIKGEINIKGTLKIDGIVTGQVNADYVILGESAFVKGDITAKNVVVGGKFEGNLRAEEMVEIKSKGKVYGEIYTRKFSVIEGGEFNGKIEMRMDESKILEFEAKK